MIRMGKDSRFDIVERFEKEIGEFLGVEHVIAVSSGTMADTIALAVLKHKFPDKKKVLAPALTFIAQINSIIYNGLEPVFYDQDTPIVGTDELLCVFPVHLLGRVASWTSSVPVIEDACEAFGSKIDGKYCGTMGDIGTFSFYTTHSISTGEGGAIVTDDDEYALLAKKLRNHGSVSYDDPLQKFHFDMIGFNGKMPSSCALEGLTQMRKLPKILEKRHENYLKMSGIEQYNEYIVPHGLPVIYATREERDAKMKELIEKGIDCRKIFSSIPTQEKAYAYLGYKLGDFPNAEAVGDRGLYVPCHENLTEEDIAHIKACL